MKQIDDYVESLFKNYRHSYGVMELKEETRTHLVESVNELLAEGKTEAESIYLAIERFGGSQYFNGELERVLGASRIFTKWLLNLALVCLVIGLLSAGAFQGMKNHYGQTQTTFTQQVFALFPQRNFLMSPKQVKEIQGIAQQDGIQMKSVQVFYEPGTSTNGKSLASHVYSRTVDANIHFSLGFATTNPNPNARQWTMYLKYRFMPYFNSILVLVPFGLLAGYWILFGVWASINLYHRKRLNLAWIIAFSCFNVLAWILFRFSRISIRVQHA